MAKAGYAMLKRLFDMTVSLTALVVFMPVLFLVAVVIKLNSVGPAIFVQRRIGLADEEFFMFKFRTMSVGTPDVATDKLSNPSQYITKVGYYLRKYSIDELPQLVNILLGDMGIVGPRPALYNQYELRDMRRKAGITGIRPGLTGWAQINGRDDIPLEEKFRLDKYYYDNRSFLLDMKIIAQTAASIAHGNGVNKKNTENYHNKQEYREA